MDYSTSTSNTAVSVSATGGWQAQNWGFQVSGIKCYLSIGGSSWDDDAYCYSPTGGNSYVSIVDGSASFSRTHSTYTVSLSAKTVNSSGYMNGTSTASATITVPAKSSYTVSYNANGGSGAPSSQTKWYGENLTLSSTKPTRTLYNFKGWATSATATTANYAAGSTYTSNSGITLYAVWELAYTDPSITNVNAFRCDSSGTANDAGTYVKVAWSYSTFSSSFPATTSQAAIGSTTLNGTTGGYSDTANSVLFSDMDLEQSYTVTITVADGTGSATTTVTIPTQYFPIDFSPEGGIGIGCVAPAKKSLAIGITLDGIYPVGSVYMSFVNTSPASLFGGSWTQLTGVFLRAANDTATGGADTHTLTVAEMPEHRHTFREVNSSGDYSGWCGSTTNGKYIRQGDFIGYSGGNQPHNNMPAYQDVYAWRRTA